MDARKQKVLRCPCIWLTVRFLTPRDSVSNVWSRDCLYQSHLGCLLKCRVLGVSSDSLNQSEGAALDFPGAAVDSRFFHRSTRGSLYSWEGENTTLGGGRGLSSLFLTLDRTEFPRRVNTLM